MVQNRLQILISAVNKDPDSLIPSMGLESDAVLVNQITDDKAQEAVSEADIEAYFGDIRALVLTRHEKGVGLSRNTALLHSDREIIQFGDDDIIYEDGYAARIVAEFDAHPEADVLLFNVKAQEGRETYWNRDFARVSWMNYGRYPAYAICARQDKLLKSGVRYSLLFGGGAPYMNGEDTLFLHDCLKAGLNVYRTPVVLGHEKKSESTWFKGYTDKFFFDRGVLYHFLYGNLAFLWGFRFLFKNRKQMCKDKGLLKCYGLLLKGARHGRTIE